MHERTLRVLMYHKVNDVDGNTVTVPTSQFDEQMAQLGELGYTVVSLDDVLAHYLDGRPLPPRRGADHVRRRLPRQPRERRPDPAASRLSGGALRADRLPRRRRGRCRTTSTSPRAGSSTGRSTGAELAELEAGGVRVESHGIGHRPLADLEVDEAAREITLSKLRLEEALGRPVRAFAYVKGSEAHYRPVHLSLLRQAGYDVAFTSISGGNGRHTDPLQLHRYNVEPYPPRTFELVLSGACDLIALKDTVAGTHARRLFNAALGTSTQVSLRARRRTSPPTARPTSACSARRGASGR